jgi:Flp pilus assembly pilin Flp
VTGQDTATTGALAETGYLKLEWWVLLAAIAVLMISTGSLLRQHRL